jgi:hypothetical protein
MTLPSVRTPRSANETRRAKQLSGMARASNRSKFIADISGFAAPSRIVIWRLSGAINNWMIKLMKAVAAS